MVFKVRHITNIPSGFFFSSYLPVLNGHPNALNKELNHLTQVFCHSIIGYPYHLVHRTIRRACAHYEATRADGDVTAALVPIPRAQRQPQPFIVIPYFGGVSEKIRRAARRFGLRTFFSSGANIQQFLGSAKDPLNLTKCRSVVYAIPCECHQMYIGETERAMKTRIQDHAATLYSN